MTELETKLHAPQAVAVEQTQLELREARTLASDATTEVNRLWAELENLETNNPLVKRLQDQLAQVPAQEEAAQAEITRLTAQIGAHQAAQTSLRDQVDTLQAAAQSAQEELERARAPAPAQEELARLRNQVAVLQQQLQAAQRPEPPGQDNLQAAHARAEQVKSELEHSQAELEALRPKEAALQQQVAALRVELDQQQQANAPGLAAQAELDSLRAKEQATQIEIDRLKAQVNEQQRKIDAAQENQDQLVHANWQRFSRSLKTKQRLKEHLVEIHKLDLQATEREKLFRNIQDYLEEGEEKLVQLQSKLGDAETDANELRVQLQTANAKLAKQGMSESGSVSLCSSGLGQIDAWQRKHIMSDGLPRQFFMEELVWYSKKEFLEIHADESRDAHVVVGI